MHSWVKKGFILPIVLTFLQIWLTYSFAKEIKIPPITVTATRIPTTFPELTRSVTIIEKDEIENAPVHSIPEILEYALGIDIIPRGPKGTQADVSIRGSTFEQVAILIDGVRVNDIQTGHHNLDIPLSLNDIERIEVLRGHGSSLYGPNAFGGVINIITKRPERRHIGLEITYGEHATINRLISLSFKKGDFGTSLSLEKNAHHGYRKGPDYSDILNVFSKFSLNLPFGDQGLSFGFQKKEFGADGFYGPFNSTEYTKCYFLGLNPMINTKNFVIEPKIYFKRHYDRFTLYEDRPSFYINYHKKWFYGGELTISTPVGGGDVAFGGEWREERIESTGVREGRLEEALGRHIDHRQALYTEYNEALLGGRLFLNCGLRGDHHSEYGWYICPQASLGYRLTPRYKLRTSIGRSFRAPTYTELYYHDPKNWGDPNLKPETAWSYELGLDYSGKIFSSITIFRREGTNTISWVEEGGVYHCKNIGEVNMTGVELDIKKRVKSLSLSLNYTYMDSDIRGIERAKEKYLHLKHKLCVGLNLPLPLGMSFSVKGRYEDRLYQEAYFVIDTRISKKIKGLQLFIEATNLFNTSYEEIRGIPMPGRWIQGGMRLF